MHYQDETLFIERFKQGANETLQELWDDHFKALVYFADGILRQNVCSEDIVSESFVKLWALKENFDAIRSVKAFLYRTVRNSCFDVLRSNEIHNRIHQEIGYTEDSILDAETYSANFDKSYHNNIRIVQEKLHHLPAACRAIFYLYYYRGFDTKKIASELAISEQTVRNQKIKGIAILKALVTQNGDNRKISYYSKAFKTDGRSTKISKYSTVTL